MNTWIMLRPDAVSVWSKPVVARALSWYRRVMLDEAPAKFIIAKHVDAGDNPSLFSLEELWRLHDRLAPDFEKLWREIREGGALDAPRPEHSFLDVKVEIALRMLRSCTFCERRCRVDRTRASKGTVCRLSADTYVDAFFHHLGEEAPLVPSGTIFYGGCNFRCVYCQNWEISQANPYSGEAVSPMRLAEIQEWLRKNGARNINHVGGEPTPNLHTILSSLKYLETNTPQLWNSNFYMSEEAMKLLVDVVDIWLPDFKYGSNKCALRLSGVPNYFDVVTRNLKIAAGHGDMIIRHLVLPGHVECCTRRVLEWIASNLPKDRILVNIMDQYSPSFLVARYPERWPEIARRPREHEIAEAYRIAEELGLNYREVS